MSCKKCNEDRPIVNKHYGLCNPCNNIRLHGNPWGKQPSHKVKKKKEPSKKSLFSNLPQEGKKRQYVIMGGRQAGKTALMDELFYEKCFNSVKEHKCEECGEPLNEVFRDQDGKVAMRWRYSHILPKSTHPELRHEQKNINHLCLKDHQRWENGDRENMKIYETNKKRYPKLIGWKKF